MDALVLILPAHRESPVLWGLCAGDKLVHSGRLPPAEKLAAPLPARVIAVVPGTAVLLREVQVPSQSDSAVRKAAPFLLEDDLAVDAADMHFALGAATDAGRWVAAVSHADMQRWQEQITALGVRATHLVPDYLAVRAAGEAPRIVDAGTHVIVRSGQGAFAAEAALLPWLTDGTFPPATQISETTRLEEAAAEVNDGAPLNLLQGAYAPRRDWHGVGQVWRRAAALSAAAAVVGLMVLVSDGLRLARDADAATARAEAIARQALPETKRIVNPRAQVRAALTELQSKGGNGFLRASSVLFTAVSEVDGVQINTLRFDAKQGDITATLSLPSFEAMERVKAAVKQRGGALQEGAARQDGGRVAAEITVKQP